jgi:polar amino acid transport system substrate-binding protein
MRGNILNFLFKFLVCLVFISSAKADELPELRWAADTDSGAPFVFYETDNIQNMTGFEYDIMKALAKKLNRKPVFVQNSWEGLIMGLQNNLYDVAINGIEITEDRQKVINFSEPYYATYLQIITLQKENRFKNLADLSGFKVGTLTGALSERILRGQGNIQVVTYESETLAHQDLEIQRIDALLFDAPIAKYFSEINPKFKVISTPISNMTYGVAVTKKNEKLLNDINKALAELITSGELKIILERWALWNSSTATLFNDNSPTRTPPTEFEKYKASLKLERSFSERLEIYVKSWPSLQSAIMQTVRISFTAMLIAVAVGLILTLIRRNGGYLSSNFITFYVELIRGTPLLLQLFFIFYALPSLGIQISAFWAAVIGLGLNYSAQESEIYRSGLNSVHPNQIEAAKMLGLTQFQTLIHVQIPQAFRFCLPPMTSDFIALIKDSSLVSVITLVELTKTYSLLSATYYDYAGFAVIAALLYLLIGLPLVVLAKFLEKKFKH